MRRGNRYNHVKKERIIMIASAVFVLAALTMTGVYVRSNSEEEKNDGYHIDFSSLEAPAPEMENGGGFVQIGEEPQEKIVSEDALDYFPPLSEADSGDVKIPGLTLFEGDDLLADEAAMAADKAKEQAQQAAEEARLAAEQAMEQAAQAGDVAADVSQQAAEITEELTLQQEAAAATTPQAPVVEYSIQAGNSLIWPVNGGVLISYNMDSTVFFPTLQQYKRNPGVVMKATEGDTITANAAGIVTEVFTDEELGNGVKVDIGRGYTAVFGQLKDLQVQEGSVVSVGTVLGFVAQPTKYYSVEGVNAYFALEKDGKPADPFGVLE